MDRWIGKVAFVTGASAGIGAAIAEELARNGLKVVALARRAEKIEELKKSLGEVKGEIFPVKGDVSREEDISECFDWIRNQFGTIHVLVNNAGIGRFSDLLTGEPQDWRDILEVNVMGLSICTKYAFQLMQDSGVNDGHIVLINSVAGHYIPTGNSTSMYCPSKFAVTAIAETLRQELRQLQSKIRVTSISPGYVRTDIMETSIKESRKAPPAVVREIFSSWPALEPKDIADGLIYALSAPAHVQVHELIIRPLGQEL